MSNTPKLSHLRRERHGSLLRIATDHESKFLPTLYLPIFNKNASLKKMKHQQTQSKFKSAFEGVKRHDEKALYSARTEFNNDSQILVSRILNHLSKKVITCKTNEKTCMH